MKKLSIVFFSLILLVSCKKEIEELPPATQTGANTFGAKVNGQFWVPQGFGPIPAGNLLQAHMAGDDLIINARNFASSPNETEFYIFLKDLTTTGTYQLNMDINHPSGAFSYAYYVKRNVNPENEWVTSSASTGSVTITRFDPVNHIVSGTFQMNMINLYNSPQPLTVTEGRFDVKLQ
jgi:hypothetical protein